jgi:hypothetical protein
MKIGKKNKKNDKKLENFVYKPLIKNNFFTLDEQKNIFNGFDRIHELNLFQPPEKTGSATKDGEILKKNVGYFLNPSEVSDVILLDMYKTLMKVFSGTTLEYAKLGFWERTILNTSRHSVLVSYYENGDEYLEHRDQSVFTVLMWFFREPKKFTGGDLYLSDIGEKIEIENNKIAIFPCVALHSVSEIKMKEEHMGKGLGRYSVTLFLNT